MTGGLLYYYMLAINYFTSYVVITRQIIMSMQRQGSKSWIKIFVFINFVPGNSR